MTSPLRSGTAWKLLISILAALAMLQIAIEVAHAFRPLVLEGMRGSLRANLGANAGLDNPRAVLRLEDDSPLQALGVKQGDQLLLDRLDELAQHYIQAGEQVGLTIIHLRSPLWSSSARSISCSWPSLVSGRSRPDPTPRARSLAHRGGPLPALGRASRRHIFFIPNKNGLHPFGVSH